MKLKILDRDFFKDKENEEELKNENKRKGNKDKNKVEVVESPIEIIENEDIDEENNDNMNGEESSSSIRDVTKKIILWALGIIIILLGVVYISEIIVPAIIFILAGILLLPPIRKYFKENKTINGLVYVFLFIAHIVFYANIPSKTNTFSNTSNMSQIVLDTSAEASNKGKYTGQVESGKRTGQGTYVWDDETTYEGEFKDNLPNGKGKITFSNGEVYEGDFTNGKKNGKGKYTFSNGDVYEGDFSQDIMKGNGKYTFANGDVYEGQFDSNMFNGKGTYTKDGTPYTGTWENNKLKE